MVKKKGPHERLLELLADDTLSPDTAYIAAAISLMEASELCKENRDSEGLLSIAKAWHDIAKSMGGTPTDEDEEKKPFGFASLELTDIGEEVGESDDPRKGGIEVRQKSRKLRKRTR
jgi:hypothetical protein